MAGDAEEDWGFEVSKPTITRVADRIVKIRYRLEGDKPLVQYHAILAELPNDAAKRAWMACRQDLHVVDGWVEVRPL